MSSKSTKGKAGKVAKARKPKGKKKVPAKKKKTTQKKTSTAPRRKASTSIRTLRADKGERIQCAKVIVKKGEKLIIEHCGGELVIDEIEVRKGGEVHQDVAKMPDGFVVGKVSGLGKQRLLFLD